MQLFMRTVIEFINKSFKNYCDRGHKKVGGLMLLSCSSA